jgi:hypothetical protein
VITVVQLAIAVSIPTVVALIGILYNTAALNKLSDRTDGMNKDISGRMDKLSERMDRMNDNFHNQVTALLTTIHGVDVRVVKLEEHQ